MVLRPRAAGDAGRLGHVNRRRSALRPLPASEAPDGGAAARSGAGPQRLRRRSPRGRGLRLSAARLRPHADARAERHPRLALVEVFAHLRSGQREGHEKADALVQRATNPAARVAALAVQHEPSPDCFWNVYLATDDCDATAARVRASTCSVRTPGSSRSCPRRTPGALRTTASSPFSATRWT